MNKQSQKTYPVAEQAQLNANVENNDMTNLQDDTENKSDNTSEDDKLSVDADEFEVNEKEEKNYVVEDEQEYDLQRQDAVNAPSWEEKYTELNDSHLRLIAEYDNYRKRTLREKADLIKSGGATALTNLLPVIDDFERAMNTLQTTDDLQSAVNGVQIIYDKFISYLSQQGVKMIETTGQLFNTDLFEAIATFPASDESQKGMVIDCVQTGYKLYDKVLRHAKVVVGE